MHTDIGCEDKLFALTHLLHPEQKGTILFKVGLFQPTIDQLITEEEGTPIEAGLDVGTSILPKLL